MNVLLDIATHHPEIDIDLHLQLIEWFANKMPTRDEAISFRSATRRELLGRLYLYNEFNKVQAMQPSELGLIAKDV
jgi:hypothetical protein